MSSLTFVVTQNCCNDATWVEVCPVNCIHPAPGEPGYATAEMLYIDPDVCIDCGACADVCPVEAIVSDDELPADGERYLALNAEYFARGDIDHGTEQFVPVATRYAALQSQASPLRVCIVGSGPAACYAAEELLTAQGIDVDVTMIERLCFAGGLLRYGVAPDHAPTKGVYRNFERTMRRKGMRFYLNTEVGRDLSIDEILDHHHAVVVAAGAAHDRSLGIDGEDLPGSHSAREFVAWYNGHPDYADLSFDFSHPRVVIVGTGNVALDVARILVTDIDSLRTTDIADHALEALAASAVEEVVLLGRRGPETAACTTPELIGLTSVEGVAISVDGVVASTDSIKSQMMSELAEVDSSSCPRRIILRFNTSPLELMGENAVTGLRVRAGDEAEIVDCGLVLRSIGYHGLEFPGMPFDSLSGTVPHSAGRVLDLRTGGQSRGRYVAGWLKRGATGAIGTNRFCARETVESLLADYTTGALADPERTADEFDALLRHRRPQVMTADAWYAIDRCERAAGREQKRPRVKLIDPAPAFTVSGFP